MLTLVIKALILILGILMTGHELGAAFLVMLLISITFTGLNQYFSDQTLALGLLAFFLLLCLFLPAGIFFLPLLVFDVTSHFKLTSVIWVVLFLNVLFMIWLEQSALLLFIHLVAILMAYMVFEIERLSQTSRNIRDDNFEQKSKLKEQNKVLMEAYDSDVHFAKLRERTRIARDIHDHIGHALSRALLQTGAIQSINQSDLLKEPLDGLQRTLIDAMNSIRNSIHDLKDEGIVLESALRAILKGCKATPHLSYDLAEPVPNHVKTCFLVVLKEAVTNTNKHSNATKIDVTVAEHPALYQLLIVDNGTLLPKVTKSGIGLENIRERIAELDGYLRTEYRDGFRIFITLPKNKAGDIND